jgi:hypothetical protein
MKVPVPRSNVTPAGRVSGLIANRFVPEPPVTVAGRSVLADPVTNRWVT